MLNIIIHNWPIKTNFIENDVKRKIAIYWQFFFSSAYNIYLFIYLPLYCPDYLSIHMCTAEKCGFELLLQIGAILGS